MGRQIQKLGVPASPSRHSGSAPSRCAARPSASTANAVRYGPPGVIRAYAQTTAEARSLHRHAAIIRWVSPGLFYVFGTPADAIGHHSTVRAS